MLLNINFGTISLAAASFLPIIFAFPAQNNEDVSSSPCPFDKVAANARKSLDKRLLLNPLTTPINVSGANTFVPPAAGDQRGPCPALNALANHGYIPHNGIVSMVDAVTACNSVYGMGVDLATFLSVVATAFTGNPLSLNPSFSISKSSPLVSNLLGNVLGLTGTPQGLVGSHNIIEADSSPTRDDLYVTGNNYALNLTTFKTWYEMVPAGTSDTFTMDVMTEFAANRFDETVATNPYFYYGPYTGLVARNAAYMFSFRLLANHSTAQPVGTLTHDIIKSFWAVQGNDEASFVYKQGWEQIPQNWYKTPEDYGLAQLNLDIVGLALKYPKLSSLGGNTGKVNTFTGVDPANLTSGLLDSTTLLESNNLMCFALNAIKLASPTYLNKLYGTGGSVLNLVLNALNVPLLSLNCPQWTDLTWNEGAMENLFPGAKMAGHAL